MKKTKIFFKETDDIVDIRYDNVFKAVFTGGTPTSKKALSRLISALIGREITVISINANEPPINNVRDRQISFDINCKARDGELINVEMSLNPAPFEPVRLEFHVAKLFTGQDIKGTDQDYDDLKQVYQIAILAKKRFFQDEEFFHSFEYYDPAREVSLNGRSRIITLELSKLDEIIKKSVEEMSAPEHWAIFFKYLTDKSKRRKINEIIEFEEGIAMASEVLINISKDEKERFRLMSEYKYELDTQSKMVTAKREGIQEGIEKGRQEGLQEGLQKGRKEGMEKGIQKEKQKIIDLLKSGKSPEDILKDYEGDS